MNEGDPEQGVLKVISQEQLQTEVGDIAKSEVLFRGKSRTIYSDALVTERRLQELVYHLESAEKSAEDPRIHLEKSLEETLEEGSEQYLNDLRTIDYTPELQESVLFPLVFQRALSKAFEEAKT